MIRIKILTKKAEMLPLLPLLNQLSPWITLESYSDRLNDMLARGYRMVTAWEDEECVGMCGIWIGTKLYSGKYMEFDNVVVSEAHRSKGIGKIMSTAAEKIAIAEDVQLIMLDAYIPNVKGRAFYERQGFEAKGYHFVKKLAGDFPM